MQRRLQGSVTVKDWQWFSSGFCSVVSYFTAVNCCVWSKDSDSCDGVTRAMWHHLPPRDKNGGKYVALTCAIRSPFSAWTNTTAPSCFRKEKASYSWRSLKGEKKMYREKKGKKVKDNHDKFIISVFVQYQCNYGLWNIPQSLTSGKSPYMPCTLGRSWYLNDKCIKDKKEINGNSFARITKSNRVRVAKIMR